MRVMECLWKRWARARAAERWAGDVPGEEPQLKGVSFVGVRRGRRRRGGNWGEKGGWDTNNTQTTGPLEVEFVDDVASTEAAVGSEEDMTLVVEGAIGSADGGIMLAI